MIPHPQDWIFTTGPELELRICLSVPKIEEGWKGGKERDIGDKNNNPFVVLAHASRSLCA